jgi:hypothetical protein
MLFFYFVPDTTRDMHKTLDNNNILGHYTHFFVSTIIHRNNPDAIQTDMFMHTNVYAVRGSNLRPLEYILLNIGVPTIRQIARQYEKNVLQPYLEL